MAPISTFTSDRDGFLKGQIRTLNLDTSVDGACHLGQGRRPRLPAVCRGRRARGGLGQDRQ